MWHEWHELQNFRITNIPPLQDQQHNNASLMQEQQHRHAQQWQKPPVGWYKCNVDAGFHNTLGRTSAGWCVRDHMGYLVMAGTSWVQGKCSIIEGEAMTLIEAMKEMIRR
ncbi:hypothetical protein A2U01_0052900, partial [Trifolium medium]|nr:hypothetical protein [Trifolium medium]